MHIRISFVFVIGRQRTGKSFLMNRIVYSTSGFKVSASHDSETKGVWMRILPHPRVSQSSKLQNQNASY